ncbi:hypothetical protein FRC07_014840 [Ceratobasidium sp. 392]|nr:hypothetical protein FRC07_014840 [Ceratobasidium sp. 392]
MSQYESLFVLMFFKPVPAHMKAIRGKFISRILSSNLIYWSMYIGARMFQSLKQDGDYANIRGYVPWLEKCHHLCITSRDDNSLEDFVGRLSSALELIFLKYIASDTNSGYNLMRLIAPTFMQIAFADPSLWPRNPSSNGVSLAHLFISRQHELGRFVFLDMVSSLTFGLPPVVEYDTSHPVITTREVHAMEWIHGCPVEFAFSIIKINAWRAQNLNGTVAPDELWKEIEAAAWVWQPRGDYGPDRESSKLVARFATQEGWRHAVLIYLYMVRIIART